MIANNLHLVLCLAILIENCSSDVLKIDSHSNSTIIPEGKSHTLFCETNIKYSQCSWTKDYQGICSTYSNVINSKQGTKCGSFGNIKWDLSETSCGIILENLATSDKGIYRCYVFAIGSGNVLETRSIDLDVATPATVSIEHPFVTSSSFKDGQYNEFVIKCHVRGGHPKPEVHAAIGPHNNKINQKSGDEMLEELAGQGNNNFRLNECSTGQHSNYKLIRSIAV